MLFVAVAAVFAQGRQQMPQPPAAADSVSESELQKFANITDSAQSIQEEIQSKVETLVEDEGMEFDRFRKIMMSKQSQQSAGQVETTQNEEEKIKSLQPKLMEINQQAQQQFVQLIQEEGLSPQRFQQIMKALQTSPDLQQRLQEARNGES